MEQAYGIHTANPRPLARERLLLHRELLVTGDTIISNAATVTKLPGGNRLDLAASLLVLCAGISFPVTVLPGHGMPWAAHSLGSFRCCTGSKTPALAT